MLPPTHIFHHKLSFGRLQRSRSAELLTVVFFSHSLKIDSFKKPLHFVKIIPLKNRNFDLALRKRLFCDAKPTLLPCKTAAFGMQNNRFRNALIIKRLRNSYACEKYLQLFRLLSNYKSRNKREKKIAGKAFLCLKRFQYTMCFIIFLPLQRSIFHRNKEQMHRYEKRNRKSKNLLDSFSICL